MPQVLEETNGTTVTTQDGQSLDTMSVVESLVKLGQKQPDEDASQVDAKPEVSLHPIRGRGHKEQ